MIKKGFTLIELLVVITIMGILMGILLVSYQGARVSARDGKRKADLEQIRSALQMYHSDCGVYPPSSAVTSENPLSAQLPCTGGTYMSKVPDDPLFAAGYTYKYISSGAEHTYLLCAFLEGGGESPCSGACSGCQPDGGCNYKVCQP